MPLTLAALAPVAAAGPALHAAFNTAVDVAVAWLLLSLSKGVAARAPLGVVPNGTTGDGHGHRRSPAFWVAAAYLCNPYTVLCCASLSTAIVPRLAVVLALRSACYDRHVLSGAAVVVAAHSNPYYLLLAAPLGLAGRWRFVGGVVAAAVGVGVVTAALCAAWGVPVVDAVSSSVAWRVSYRDLTPTPHVAWYMFAEVFPRFQPYFTLVFQLHPLLYVAPLGVRFGARRFDLYAALVVALVALTTPFGTLGDTALAAALLCMHPGPMERLSAPTYLWAAVLVGAMNLMPAIRRQWLHLEGGNPNFVFGMGFATFLSSAALLGAVTAAAVREERELSRARKAKKER